MGGGGISDRTGLDHVFSSMKYARLTLLFLTSVSDFLYPQVRGDTLRLLPTISLQASLIR